MSSSNQQQQQQDNSSQATSVWTEPPWSGWIETTGDALLILEAARRGLIPRVTRRLVDSERKMITSGSVFVFDEDESGIKRWTDGFFWSPSRILGNFLLYRETDKRGAGHRGSRSDPSPSEMGEQPQYSEDGKAESQALSRPKGEGGQGGIDRHRERTLVGSLTNSYKFKPDGLMKKTFSLTISGVSQHLISYYKIEDVEGGRLRSPSSLPELASLDISPEYLDKTHFRNPPKVEFGPDGVPRYRGEADDSESTPSLLPAPLSSGLPLLTDGTDGASTSKRNKRYDPYGAALPPKRSRKSKTAQAPTSIPAEQQLSPAASPSSSSQQPPPPHHAYADPNMPVVPPHHPHYTPYGMPIHYQMPGYPVPPPPHPHMYPASPYGATSGATNGIGAVPHQAGMAGQQQQHPYPGYPTPAGGFDGSPPGQQQQQQQQQPYYPYYPAPPGHYPGYAGVPWPHYAGYPPQPMVQQAATAVSGGGGSEGENKDGGAAEGTESKDN